MRRERYSRGENERGKGAERGKEKKEETPVLSGRSRPRDTHTNRQIERETHTHIHMWSLAAFLFIRVLLYIFIPALFPYFYLAT